MAVNNSLNINPSTPLILAWGGTNASLTASNGGLVYTDASKMAILSGTATANQIPLSGSSSAPAWSTATYLATLTANGIVYASASNTMAQISTANNGVLITSNSGVPSLLANSGTPGFVLTANSGAPPSWQAATGGFTWANISGTTQAAAVNTGYVVGNASQTTITLPATAALGSVVAIQGKGAAGWILTANTGQTIQIGQVATTSGGTVTSAANFDAIRVVCITADTTWSMEGPVSNGFTTA